MKGAYLTLLATLYFATVHAQLTVTNHAPSVGEMHQRYQCDSTGIVPGAGGANMLWNFSVATRSSVVHSYTAGNSSFYPPATVSVTSNRSYEDHYKIQSNALLDYSSSFPLVSGYYIELNYTNGSIKAKYPMSFNTISTAAISGNINAIMINPQAGTFNGTSSTFADGTGTLVLPGITYTDVIRVVNTETLSYSVSFPGTIVLKNYEFYAVGAKYPVFCISTATLTRPAATVRRTLVTRLIHVIPAAPADLTPESNKQVCANTSATLSVSGEGTIEWFDDNSATTVIGSGSTFVTDPLTPGVYTYYARSNNFMISALTSITFTVGECTSLGPDLSPDLTRFYPNPTHGVICIEPSNGVNVLKVFNSEGKLLKFRDAEKGPNYIDMSNFPDGVYIIKLFSDKVLHSVKKVHLQKD